LKVLDDFIDILSEDGQKFAKTVSFGQYPPTEEFSSLMADVILLSNQLKSSQDQTADKESFQSKEIVK
jgi:hypothetical protein